MTVEQLDEAWRYVVERGEFAPIANQVLRAASVEQQVLVAFLMSGSEPFDKWLHHTIAVAFGNGILVGKHLAETAELARIVGNDPMPTM